MTKEEAIDYIIPAIKNYWNDKICDDIIKTLAQEPCEDGISRKWIKEAIHNFYKGLNHIPTEEDIQRYIEVAPSVNSSQRQAESEVINENRNN